MNGHIIPGTPIAVDFWKKRECPSAKFFFLTHLHGDHTVGLSSSWQYNIYCSEITSKLLVNKYGIKEELINCLEVGSSNIIYMDEEKQEQLVVSVINANHCPGSVMYLFEGYFGKVLYTGDFRYCDSMFADTPLTNITNVDVLYLDNTYCSPECVFLTREEAVDKIIWLIKQHPDHRIVIGMRNLGKEDLLIKIAEVTQEWISVPSPMYKTAEILGLPNVFCIDDMDCKIRIVPFHTVTRTNALEWDDFEPTLVILPTALYTGLGCTPYQDASNIHVIPYSDHSSYKEICTFVERVKPKFILPIVNERPRGGIFGKLADRSDLSCLQKYLSTEPGLKYTVPPSVKRFMSMPMTSYMKKVSRQKRTISKTCLKKRSSISLGVVYESPPKSQLNESCEDFINKLEKMRKSFKKIAKMKSNHKENKNNEHEQDISDQSNFNRDKNQDSYSDFSKNHKEFNMETGSTCKSCKSPVLSEKLNNSNCISLENDLSNGKSNSTKSDSDDSVRRDHLKTSEIKISTKKSKQLVSPFKETSTVSSIQHGQQRLDLWIQKPISVEKPDEDLAKKDSQNTSCSFYHIQNEMPENNISSSESDKHSAKKEEQTLSAVLDLVDNKIPKTISTDNLTAKSDLHLIYSNSILPVEKIKVVPLKPLNMKRSLSDTSEIGLLPLKPLHKESVFPNCNGGKRSASDDINIIPLKKARSVL